MNWIFDPWPWFIGGPLIAFVMLLLLLSEKKFGMSSNLKTICAAFGTGKSTPFFNYDWKSQRWNIIVVLGAFAGGLVGSHFLSSQTAVELHTDVIIQLQALNISDAGQAYMPDRFFGETAWTDWRSLSILAIGGFLVGFGARYAGGCTSGHAISGLSNLQMSSLIAVIGFFIGGIIMNHFLIGYIL